MAFGVGEILKGLRFTKKYRYFTRDIPVQDLHVLELDPLLSSLREVPYILLFTLKSRIKKIKYKNSLHFLDRTNKYIPTVLFQLSNIISCSFHFFSQNILYFKKAGNLFLTACGVPGILCADLTTRDSRRQRNSKLINKQNSCS